MGARVTIQDIADELGISRNTVSKAINNTGILADATRDKVLKRSGGDGLQTVFLCNGRRFGKLCAFRSRAKKKKTKSRYFLQILWEETILQWSCWINSRRNWQVLGTASPCTGSSQKNRTA